MKKALRVLIPIFLVLAILVCSVWYLFVYDQEFTRDMLLGCARFCENQNSHKISTWFYNLAYAQAGDNDAVAIELAEQYKRAGNYTKAEFTLSNAIADGGGIDLYIALSKTFVEQDKMRDAVLLLDNITNESVKAQLDALRPAAPTVSPAPSFYNQYITITLEAEVPTIYASLGAEYPSTTSDFYSEPIALKEGENTLSAIAVSDNGLVSARALFGYTIGGVVEKVEFADPVIEEYIRSVLNVGEKTVVYNRDLWNLTELVVSEEVTSYEDLRHMINLENLTIENAIAEELQVITNLKKLNTLKITNAPISPEVLSGISVLPDLKNLILTDCSLSSIAPLSSAVGLETLDLSGNTIRNIDAIGAMENLKELYLQHNALNDLTAISGLKNLKTLNVSYNALTTLTPVYAVAGLTWLDASNNSIEQLGDIDTLVKLSYLALSNNTLSDVSKIAACTELTELYVSSNAITDITMLKDLSKLQHFAFAHNQIVEIPAFSQESALVTIDGSHNLIETLAPLKGLSHLNKVHMDYNEKISSVAELASCPLLIEVNVYATAVTDVTMLTDQSIIVNFNPVKKTEE